MLMLILWAALRYVTLRYVTLRYVTFYLCVHAQRAVYKSLDDSMAVVEKESNNGDTARSDSRSDDRSCSRSPSLNDQDQVYVRTAWVYMYICACAASGFAFFLGVCCFCIYICFFSWSVLHHVCCLIRSLPSLVLRQ